MVQNGRLINQECTWELNRTVLQRIDHHIEDILISAGHVTLYEFNVDTGQWSRKDVEGSLFVVKRRTKPRFQFIVMNRRSTENLVEDLLDDFEYELQVPYLLYRNAAQEVNGIWFYNCRECEEVANLLSRILNAYSKNPPKRKLFSPPQGDDFRELEAVPTPATVEGPLEPQAMASASGVTTGSLEGFFNIATRLNSHDSVVPSGVKSNASPQVPETPPPPPPPPLPVPLPTAQSVIETGSTKSMEVPLKPYFFVPPPLPSSQPNTLHPPPLLQPSVGAPLLQPFPPPVPSLSLTPVPFLAGQPVVSREGVRDALVRLVKNDTFIDMVFEEMLKAQGLPA